MRRGIKFKSLIIILFIIMLVLINFSVSKYKSLIEEKGTGVIAEPIVVLEKDAVINSEYSKKTGVIEYFFNIKNYKDEKVNEVDCIYNIEIIENNQNFPIQYKLIDLTNNQEIVMENNKTTDFLMESSIKDEDKYKLEISWLDKSGIDYSDSLQIALKTNVVQVYN